MKQNRFELEVKNRTDNLPVIGDFVADALMELGADAATLSRVQLVVDEACTNVIKYAYPGEGVGDLKLVLEVIGNTLVVTLTDRGKPFDPGTIPPPDLSSDVEERRIGGLGVYFIKKVMDEVSYSYDAASGNQLTMKKKLPFELKNPAQAS